MTPDSETRRYSFDEWIRFDRDSDWYDLVEGRLVPRPPSVLASAVGADLSCTLHGHAEVHQPGNTFGAGLVYRCFPWSSDTARRPNVTFVAASRMPADWLRMEYMPIPPDLAVEIVPQTNDALAVHWQIMDWLRAGVRLVWIIDPTTRVAFVWRPDRSGTMLSEDDELSGEDVIPGFLCRVADLFPERPVPQAAPALAAEPA